MSSPEVSVIMPVYNAQTFLADAISSILEQSFKYLELILVDDGSTDSSYMIMSEFATKDSRVKLVKNEQNLGLTTSLNVALDNSSGRYIARMDSDDIAVPDRIQTQFEFLESNHSIFLCGTFAQTIDENGTLKSILQMPTDGEKLLRRLEQNNCIIHPTIMFRSEPKLRYRPKFGHVEDYDLYLRAITLGLNLAVIPEVLLNYRVIGTSITRQKFVEQAFLKRKVIEYYQQRKEKGFDDYENFEQNQIRAEISENPQLVALATIINAYNQSHRLTVLKLVGEFLLSYGYKTEIVNYGLAALLPKKIVKLIKR